jgi:AcrR family transcriptional regulator
MEKKPDRRIKKSKDSIRRALLELMADKKMSEITISELADAANITRKTFYQHYSIVNDVLDDIEKDIHDRMDVLLSKFNFGHDSFKPYQFFLSANKALEDDIDFYSTMIETGVYTFFIHEIKNRLKEPIIEMAKSRGYKDNDKLQYAAEYTSSGIIAVYLHWFESGKKISLKELAEMAEEFIIKGMKNILK